jgi:hypothetical protein
MQELGDNTIRRVDWQNVFPAVLLPRAFKFALGLRVILLAFVGLAVTSVLACFFVPERSLLPNVNPPTDLRVSPDWLVMDIAEQMMPGYFRQGVDLGTPKYWCGNVVPFSVRNSLKTTVFVQHEIAHPWSQLTATGHGVLGVGGFRSLAWFAIVLVIWAWVGGMMTRIVALRFAQDRRESFSQLLDFMRKKWLSYIGAILLPLIAMFIALLPVWLLGDLWRFINALFLVSPGHFAYSICGFGHVVTTLPFALVTVLITIGFMLGWPLMFAAISAEGSDAFDAISRGFSYVYQRPIQFVFYHLCNLVIYTIGIIIAYFVFHQTITLIGYDPASLMIIFNSFAFAYFWSSSTVIYFLLRRSCDATPYNQVFLGDIKKRTLPPFAFGKNGEPELKTETP